MRGFVFIVLILMVMVGCEKSSDFTYKKPTEITYIATLPIDSVFEIRAFKLEQWDVGEDSDAYTLIYKNESTAYAFADVNEETSLSISEDDIKTAFSKMKGSDSFLEFSLHFWEYTSFWQSSPPARRVIFSGPLQYVFCL